MNNSQISEKIKLLSSMMNLLEENPFKIRAFDKASRIIENHPEEMGVLIDEDRLKDVPGIGDGLAHIILYYAKSGMTSLEKELTEKLPHGLPELLTLPGLGVKKVRQLWQENGINNLDELKLAAEQNLLAELKGFGPKIQLKLIDAIAFREQHSRHFHLDIALKVADEWQAIIESFTSIQRIELTGQLRRGNELLESVDFIVQADLPSLIKELESTNCNLLSDSDPIILHDKSGMSVHLNICSSENFFSNQLLLTGGDIYQKDIKRILKTGGMSTVQNFVDDKAIKPASEEALCHALGLKWIEPELRDHFGADSNGFELITTPDIKGIFHAHSTWSDGVNSLQEMALATRDLGYQYLGISDHSQAAYYANGLQPERVRAQWDAIDELNDKLSDFHVFKGIEADILKNGDLDYDEELLQGFDFVIASIHSHFHMDSVKQTDRIIRALQSPLTTMLGHPTGRMLMAREGYNPDMPAIISVAAEYDKIIEINTTPKRLDLDWRHLKFAREKGVKISINPDAHRMASLATIPLGVKMARKGGISPSDVINSLNVDEMETYLRSRGTR